MRHQAKGRQLSRTAEHRRALLRNMATSLFLHGKVVTTEAKAKELRPYAEKLITLAKRDDDRLHARRQVARDIQDPTVLKKLFDTLGARYATRPGGYTRILRLGTRRGDGAEMAVVELLGSEYQPGKKDEKGKKTATETKPAAKKAASPKPRAEKVAKGEKKKGSAKSGRKAEKNPD
jgi:large subunit ribosomal protein L17